MTGFVVNIHTKNYQNQIIGFQITVKNVGDVFFETQCSSLQWCATFVFMARACVERDVKPYSLTL